MKLIEKQIDNKNLNYWHLGCILSASIGIPGMFIGKDLAAKYGIESAIISIIIGNLIIWIISLGIIAMSFQGHNNAIENAKKHVGKWGGIISLILLVIDFSIWNSLQLEASVKQLDLIFHSLIPMPLVNKIQLGAILGFFIAILAMGGINFIKWICTITVPFFIIYILYNILLVPISDSLIRNWSISLPAIIVTINTVLSGVVFLPTIFQHSKSKADSYFGLIIMTVFVVIFQISTIWLNNNYSLYPYLSVFSFMYAILTVFYVLLSLICSNLVNIYLAAMGYAAVAQIKVDAKIYVIISFIGTSLFVFFQIPPSIKFLEELSDGFIANLSVVLVIAFLLEVFLQHRPRVIEKFINNICWFIGCIVTLTLEIYYPDNAYILGISATSLAFLLVFFLEEAFVYARELILFNIKDRKNFF